MDNFSIDVTAEKKDSLMKAMEIAFAHNAPGNKVESYQIVTFDESVLRSMPDGLKGKTALVLRWGSEDHVKEGGPVNLPFKLDALGSADFAWRWLSEQNYGRQPDHDGDNGHGWRLLTGAWGHVAGDRYAVCAVVPEWAMYGK